MKIFIAVICSVMLIAALTIAEETQNMGQSDIVIEGPTRGDIAFPHEKHQQALGDCNHCHNLFPQESGAIQKLNAEGKLTEKQVMDQCRDCHKSLKEAGKTSGPTKCSECHTKKG